MDLLTAYDRLKKDFPSWPSLIWVIVAIIVFCSLLETLFVSLGLITTIRITIYLIIFISGIGLWVVQRRSLPKNKNEKIGIVIGIDTENDRQKILIKNDFVERIKESIKENNLETYLEVIVLNEYQQKRVNKILFNNIEAVNRFKKNPSSDVDLQKTKKAWTKIRNKINGHFWIRGLVKERKDIENKYFLDLDAGVSHSPIEILKKNPIEDAFKTIWFHKISFAEKLEFKGFTFTADLVFIAAKYLTGIAALISRDPFTAFRLHENLDSDFAKFKPLPENLQQVCKQTKEFLEEESILICKYYLEIGDCQNSELYLNKVFIYKPNSYDGYLLKSNHDFIFRNDIPEALYSCKLAAKNADKNGTWRYNKAFLLLNSGKYKEALTEYMIIENYSFEDEDIITEQVINFNTNYLKLKPDKYFSLWILGFIYYKKNKNYPLAFDTFSKFLDNARKNTSQYHLLIDDAKKSVKEIKSIMKIR